LSARCQPQVVGAIVVWIAVAVIQVARREISMFVQPDKAMR
jgi:hypothetical protein